MMAADLPAGMVTVGEALQGFLTELEERCREAPARDHERPIWHERD